MNEMPDHERETQEPKEAPTARTSGWVIGALLVAILLAVVAFTYGFQQQATVNDLNAQVKERAATIDQLKSQTDSMSAKLNEVAQAQAQAQEAAAKAAKAPAKGVSARTRAANDKRFA